MKTALVERIALLNALEKEFAEFSGSAAESKDLCSRKEKATPSGYLGRHGDGSFRVFSRSSGCLTPNGSVPMQQAVDLAVSHHYQTEIVYDIAARQWFAFSAASSVPAPAEDVCRDCEVSHKDQLSLFPVNATVIALCDIPAPCETSTRYVEKGTLGHISDHCDDGRAFVRFDVGGCHTFHKPEGYIDLHPAPVSPSWLPAPVGVTGTKLA